MAKTVSALLDPVTLFMVGIILGCLVYLIKKKVGVFLIVVAALYLWLFSLPSIVGLISHYMERNITQYSATSSGYEIDNKSIDFIVIMGGFNDSYARQSATNNLASETTKRFLEGLVIANKIPTAKLIVSGQESHAEHVKRALMDWGITEERILVNHHVQNTQEEIESIVNILASTSNNGKGKGSSLMIISTARHIPRIKIWAKYYGLFPLYSGVNFKGFLTESSPDLYASMAILVPRSSAATTSHALLHEVAGILYAKIFILRNKYL
ncbi:MAG: DUF218 domain-containing protein [Candidatus Portiera sp.]|nr:DUF218 domain-containing protein [Portiera sp.]